jgi:hypothetical protein
MWDPLPAPAFNPVYDVRRTDIGLRYATGIELMPQLLNRRLRLAPAAMAPGTVTFPVTSRAPHPIDAAFAILGVVPHSLHHSFI